MTVWAVIPVKPADEGKSRLAGVLSADQRRALACAMLQQVVDAARAAPSLDRVSLVGTTRNGQPDTVELLPDPGLGLNAALHSALERAGAAGVSRLVIIHADLPQVTSRDLDLLAGLPGGVIGIAPDRHHTGTNALSLPLPLAADFRFAFGPGSLALHMTEAARFTSDVVFAEHPGLSRDVDEPGDLADAAHLL